MCRRPNHARKLSYTNGYICSTSSVHSSLFYLVGQVTAKAPVPMGTDLPTFNSLLATGAPLVQHLPPISSQPSLDPLTTLTARLVKRILDYEFVEMDDLLPDAWLEEPNTRNDGLSAT